MSVWDDLAEPVLRSIKDAKGGRLRDGILALGRGRGSEALGLPFAEAEIHRAILLLMDEEYIDADLKYEWGPEPSARLTKLHVTPAGHQALGEWPRFELLVTPSTLAAMLEKLAEQAAPEDQGPLRKAAAYVRGLSADTLRTAFVAAGVILVRQKLGLS
jgi:hypothetical protein